MKNLLKRSVAFMLVVCMLLSVVPIGTISADATTMENDVITYDIIDPNGGKNGDGGSGYVIDLKGSPTTDLTDFTFIGYGSNNSHTRLVEDSTHGYRININSFQLTNDATTNNKWIALKFSVAEAGTYALNVLKGTFRADVVVEKYDDTKTYNDAYVAALTSQGTTNDTITCSVEKGDYVLFLKSNSTAKANHSQFYGMTLTWVGETTSYTFHHEKFLGEWAAYATGDNLNLFNGNLQNAIAAEYDAEGIDWKVEVGHFVDVTGSGSAKGDILHAGNETDGYYLRVRTYATRDDSTDDPWVAFRLRGVETAGLYSVVLNTRVEANNTSDADIFLIPASVIDTAVAEGATAETAIAAAISGDTYKKNSEPVGFKSSETAKKLEAVSLAANEEFLLVMRANAPRAGDYTDSNAWMGLVSLDLVKCSDAYAVAVVDAQIAAIGDVTLESEAAIVAARAAYEALPEEHKALVTNLSVLEAAEAALEEEKNNDPVANQAAADPVIALINEIDAEITLASEDKIAAAREAYDALTERQKALVSNAQTLFDAEAALQILLDQVAAGAVIEKIDAIGEVTLEDEATINDARTLYTALTEEQKALVTNYETLTAAEATLAALKQQAAVDETIAKIDAIGTVTLDSADAISAARAAYNALSEEQKALVTNYDVLVAAEADLKDLRNPNPDPSTFDGIVYDFTTAVDLLNVADGAHPSFNNQTIADAYENGTINYTYYGTNRSVSVSNGYRPVEYQCIHLGGYAQDWFAVKIQSPGAGTTYKFNFTYPALYNVNYSSKVDAYVLPISAVEAAIAAAGEGATADTVVGTMIASGSYAPVASKNIKQATNTGAIDEDDFWGTVTFDSDEEHVVVFYAAENKHGGTQAYIPDLKEGETQATNCWMVISGFYLTTPPTTDDVAAAEAVIEKIDAIGTVTRGSGDQIAAARAAYEALTAKQKELVENLAVLEAAEARLAELLDPANPIEYIFKLGDHPVNEKGYPSALGLTYGDFTDYARSGNIFKPYASYAQPQTSFVKGKWIGMKFTVDQAGDYNVALNLINSGTDLVTLDVYFVRADELVQGSGNTKNQEFIDGLASNSNYKCYKVDIANAETLSLTGVQLDADEYVIVMINTSGYSVQISETEKKTYDTKCNFYGFAITRTGDYTGPVKVVEQPLPDPDTDKLVYDFYMEGATSGTNIYDPAIMEVLSKNYGLNKTNWMPVIDKLNTVYDANYGTSFQNHSKKYDWIGIVSSTTVGEWMALQIKAPGTGTYDLTLEHAKNVNGSSVSSTYVIPVSALKDLSAASIEAAIADDTYKLIASVSYKGSGGGHLTEVGQVDFEKGKDYVIVFHATTNKHGSQKVHEVVEGKNTFYEGFLLPQKLTVTKFVPPAPLDQKEVVYDFQREDMAEGSNVFSDKSFGAVTTDYIKGNSYWKPYATTVGTVLETYSGKANFVNGNGKNYKFEGIMVNSLPGEWIGFQIKSPGKGLYTLSLTYGINTNCTTKGEIHIIPLDKLSGDPVEAVEAAIKTGEYKLQRDVNFKKGSEKYNTGKYGQFTFEYGEEYIIVFKAAANKHGGEGILQTNKETGKQTPYQAFMILSEMKLTYATKVESFEEEEEAIPDVTGQSDPEAAAAVDALIDAIGSDITLDSSSAIAAARAAYDLLTANQKKLVTKYQTLLDAEAKLAELVSADDKAKAEAVIAKIDAIGTVTLESESTIVAARIAYTLLTNSQRALVTNYSVLLAAEAKLAELKGESGGSALDQASADAVETLISKIGTVTLESEGAISAARNAYNALTATQKLLVENYDVLVAAEKALAELKAEQQAAQDAEEAAKRKAQQITIMIVAAVVAAAAAGVVTVFAVPSIRAKVLAMFSKNKKKV